MPQAARPAQMMSLMDAVNKCLKSGYVDFSGRATRSEYWWFQLAMMIGLGGFATVMFGAAAAIEGSIGGILAMLPLLAYLAILPPALAVIVRRLHDLGKSGWMILVGFIPLVGGILLLVWFLSDGQPQDNQYGPVPTNKL